MESNERKKKREGGNESTFAEYLLHRIVECLKALDLEQGCLGLNSGSASF